MQKPKTEAVMAKKEAKEASSESELVELCRKMRLMSERDTDATLPQVLKVMMVHSRGQPVGGSELSELSGINRITIIHHMKRLEGAGFVRREEGKYILRVRSAEDMILEFRKEMERNFVEMDEMAREFDEQFAQMEREFDSSTRVRALFVATSSKHPSASKPDGGNMARKGLQARVDDEQFKRRRRLP